MLHILLLILKIIGILLLVLILLIFLLFLTVSISPLCYRAEASCQGNPDTLFGRVQFHWLFHLISGEVLYDSGEVKWWMRLAWKHMGGEEEEDTEPDGYPDQSRNSRKAEEKTIPPDEGQTLAKRDRHYPEKALEEDVKKSVHDHDMDEKEPHPEKTPDISKTEPQKGPAPAQNAQCRKVSQKEMRGPAVRTEKKEAEKESLSERLEKYVERIKYTFRKFCDKMKVLTRKKDRLKAFIESEVHRNAFFRVVRELKRFLGFLGPKKLNINVEFGCRNPEYTGYILAGISMIYPVIGEFTQLQPDFERRILKGNAYIEGKFRIMYVLITAWNLIWDKNVRTTYRHIRKFKL